MRLESILLRPKDGPGPYRSCSSLKKTLKIENWNAPTCTPTSISSACFLISFHLIPLHFFPPFSLPLFPISFLSPSCLFTLPYNTTSPYFTIHTDSAPFNLTVMLQSCQLLIQINDKPIKLETAYLLHTYTISYIWLATKENKSEKIIIKNKKKEKNSSTA